MTGPSGQSSSSPPPRSHAEYLAGYRAVLEKRGPCFDALLWVSPYTQETRFRVLHELVAFAGRRVLDAGCGFGDLPRFLARHHVHPAAYTGIDALPEMLHRARRDAPPSWHFLHADFVAHPDALRSAARALNADTLVFCGSLNTLEQHQAVDALSLAWNALTSIPRSTAPSAPPPALVFNFLATRPATCATGGGAEHDADSAGPARRFDPDALLAWAHATGALVRTRRDYLDGGDASVALFAT